MEPTIEIPIDELSRQLKLSSEQITNATRLLDAGHSVPFLALFRLDETHGLGEGSLARLEERLQEVRQLERRKTGLIEYLRHRDGLTDEIGHQIQAAADKEEVDQLYAIHKRSRPPKGAIDRTEPLHSVVSRILDNSIDLAELDSEYVRIAQRVRDVFIRG